jgi:hypothetical protein
MASTEQQSPDYSGERSDIPRNGDRLRLVFLPDTDDDLPMAHRYRELVSLVVADQGGAAYCSEARLQLIRRFASGAVLAEALEARLVTGEKVDISEHALLSSTLVRLGQRIGIDRRAKHITPNLTDYLEVPKANAAPDVDD